MTQPTPSAPSPTAPDAVQVSRVAVTLPYLPPSVLGKNGRGWTRQGVSRSGRRYYASEFASEFARVKADAYRLLRNELGYDLTFPEGRWVMDVFWLYSATRHHDDDNVVAMVAPLRDAAQQVGLVANDAQIVTGYVTFQRVARGNERCAVVFTRIEDQP